LLAAQMPGILREMEPFAVEVIIVDNGSDDGTAQWLRAAYPQARIEASAGPLSFARAVNRGIALARFSHVCLLNNDMLVEPGFFRALRQKFDEVTSLFCATAQIQFPAGARREETGKAVMAQAGPEDFPVRCDEPLPGEDGTYVLYGSGGCSLYDVAKLRALGCVDEAYEPAYVEDLDLGYRAWQRGWPTVFVAGAVVEHRHRATTRRYYTEEQLEAVLEVNYLKFVARSVGRRSGIRAVMEAGSRPAPVACGAACGGVCCAYRAAQGGRHRAIRRPCLAAGIFGGSVPGVDRRQRGDVSGPREGSPRVHPSSQTDGSAACGVAGGVLRGGGGPGGRGYDIPGGSRVDESQVERTRCRAGRSAGQSAVAHLSHSAPPRSEVT
jgi:GT2 family glycosyltransferase